MCKRTGRIKERAVFQLGSHTMAWRGIASDGYLCSERVTLHGVVGGGRYALPGACTPENGWTLNGVQFQVENILGRHLLCLERGADGSWDDFTPDNTKVDAARLDGAGLYSGSGGECIQPTPPCSSSCRCMNAGIMIMLRTYDFST